MTAIKPVSRTRRFKQHIQRLRELGQQDASKRCAFCKRQLPPTGVYMVAGRPEMYCDADCLADHDERISLVGVGR